MTTHPAVVATGVTVRHGDRVALDDATFEIPAGTLTAVIGPNGSGKSTLLGAIAGLLSPSAGTLTVHGRDPEHAHRQVAYVLQMTNPNEVVPLTVREVVKMGRYAERGMLRRITRADRDLVEASMERLDICDIATRDITELSGGQRQRAFVAQGLAQQADVLLLDEPVTGLDAPSQRRIQTVIAEERDAGRTIIVTTHDIDDASHADHVVLLSGRVVASGPPSYALTTQHLGAAFGGHAHVLEDGTVVIDDPHHHR